MSAEQGPRLRGCDGHDYFRAADSYARNLNYNRSEAAI
jgi:hypothetical protein